MYKQQQRRAPDNETGTAVVAHSAQVLSRCLVNKIIHRIILALLVLGAVFLLVLQYVFYAVV